MKRNAWKERWKKVMQGSFVNGYGVLEIRRWTYAWGVIGIGNRIKGSLIFEFVPLTPNEGGLCYSVKFDGAQKFDVLGVGWTVTGGFATEVFLVVVMASFKEVNGGVKRKEKSHRGLCGLQMHATKRSGRVSEVDMWRSEGAIVESSIDGYMSVLFVRSGGVKRSILWGGLEEMERMKVLMPICIAENQSAFVPGRILSDNILIAHELLHYLKGSKNGPNKGAAVKLDVEKVYDRVEWHFINDVMERMGFAASWINLIMNCVTSVSFCIKVNGQVSEFFRPSRGLRQGDPLSPYIFLFCTQGLSSLLLKERSLGNIKGVRASQNGPRITHILYADDCLLFLKNSAGEAQKLKDILSCYEGSSGQKVNVEKSYIYFSNGMTYESKREISRILCMRDELEVGNYLGLPLIVGKSKLQALRFLNEKVDKRVNGWTKNLLSFGGREPITNTMRGHWWSGRANARGWAHVAWNKVCRPKLLGGIGLRDLHLFNFAMLAKQIWRLLTCKESLCFKVMSAKYFLGGNILEAKRGDKTSFIWSGLYKTKVVFAQGFWWRPGMHNEIRMFIDCWGGDKQIQLSCSYGNNSPNPIRCKEFMMSDGKSWDIDKVRQVFIESDANAIIDCPICPIQGDLQGMEGDHSSIRKPIVLMPTLPKIKIFAWRLCFEAFPLGRKLAAAGIDPGICKMCQGSVETCLHAFRDCPSIKEAFDLSNLSTCLPDGEFTNCKTWLESAQSNLLNAQETSRASTSNSHQERCTRPLQDKIKVNVDGAFNPMTRKEAVGVIARNSYGMMIDGCAFQLSGFHTADSAEACAFKEGAALAIENGWIQVDFEGDASNIVSKLVKRDLDRSLASAYLQDTMTILENHPGFSFGFLEGS
ncbi:hypothetical protein GQ457_15G020000 [Hibiscus cannabinus]